MKYSEAIDYINSAAVFGIKLGLENIKKLLELVGNPHEKLKVVHVAGTNGKGSVCSYIANILKSSGYRTGLFTSPYLEKFTERIQVDFNNIPDNLLIQYVSLLKEKIKTMTDEGWNHPTFFELNTAIAFMYYKDTKCDAVVLETGLGGRYDSTNIVRSPVVSVITTIGYDHMGILGDTLAKIAFEKAGIIKRNRPVVMYGENEEEAASVIIEAAREKESDISMADFNEISNIRPMDNGYVFDYKELKDTGIKLLGKHQIKNACLAIEAAWILNENDFNISDEKIKEGLLNTSWPGRIEIINKKPVIICDATHNPQGAGVLKETLEERFKDKDVVFIMGVMKDKDYRKIAEIVLKDAKGVVTVTPDWHRALDAKVLLETVKIYCKNSIAGDTIEEAMKHALEMAGEEGIICTLGSLYYIADVKRFVREKLGGIQ